MTTLGKFELYEELGRGGFGIVYRAVDTDLKRAVALKVLHPQLIIDLDFLEKFKREARLMAALDNPGIVTIYEMGEADGRVFIALRYMAGGSLKDRLEKKGAIPYKETFTIFKHICEGLHAAHERGLVHRDIKPANILFDAKGNAVISDFGLAKTVLQSSVSATSTMGGVGTPAYRAPELWRGKPPASPATDVYSLGCILCEMLTGKVLFDGSTPDAVITQHLIDGPQIPEHFSNEVPTKTREIIQKALNKDPEKRFANCLDLMESLDNIITPQEPPIEKNRDHQTNFSSTLISQPAGKPAITKEDIRSNNQLIEIAGMAKKFQIDNEEELTFIGKPKDSDEEWQWLEQVDGKVIVPAGYNLGIQKEVSSVQDMEDLLEAINQIEDFQISGLDLNSSDISNEMGEKLTEFKWLTYLDLGHSHNVNVDLMNTLSSLSQLSELILDNCYSVTDEGLAAIHSLAKLKKLDLSFCDDITDIGLAYIASLTNLEVLYLGRNYYLDICKFTDEGLEAIQNLIKIKSLHLDFCHTITDTGLLYIANLTNLEDLNLRANDNITDEGLAAIQNLTKLKKWT